MQRLTGNQAYDLMEAYNSIYESEQITEEQIVESFNIWIDDLLNEGYDLSDYTYDDLYEYYLSEGIPLRAIGGAVGKVIGGTWKHAIKPIFVGVPKKTPGVTYGAGRSLQKLGAWAGRIGAPIIAVQAAGPMVGNYLKDVDKQATGGAITKILGHGHNALKGVGEIIPDPNDSSGSSSSSDSTSPEKSKPPKSLKILGGKIVGYNEGYDFYGRPISEDTSKVFAPVNGKPGYIIKKDGKSQWMPVDTKQLNPEDLKRLDQDLQRYSRTRGPEQIKRDMEASNKAKAEQEARRQQSSSTSGTGSAAPAAGQGKPSGGQGTGSAAPAAGQGKPSGGQGTGSAAPAAGQGKPSGGQGTGSAAPAAGPSTPKPGASTPKPGASSPANLPTADKIKSGMAVWNQQMKAGDTAGATETGKGVWAMANPRLAAVAAEKERIRGTAQTDNPLMKDFRSRLPAASTEQTPNLAGRQAPSTPLPVQRTVAAPVVAGRQAPATPTPVQRTVAAPGPAATPIRPVAAPVVAGRQAPATPTQVQRPVAAPIRPIVPTATQPIRSTSVTGKQNPIQSTANKMPQGGKQRSALLSHYEHEPYDIILEYLVSRGHADTLNEANYLMLEMDQESIQNIMEEYENYLLSEEISEWVTDLVYGGYDLSDYDWDSLVEYYLLEKFGTVKGRKKLAKKIQAGKDIGKRGSGFEAIVKKASPKYGKERATKIAAAAMWKTYGK
jgi:hypothetical protein